jgi:hypothetical protein
MAKIVATPPKSTSKVTMLLPNRVYFSLLILNSYKNREIQVQSVRQPGRSHVPQLKPPPVSLPPSADETQQVFAAAQPPRLHPQPPHQSPEMSAEIRKGYGFCGPRVSRAPGPSAMPPSGLPERSLPERPPGAASQSGLPERPLPERSPRSGPSQSGLPERLQS